MKRLTTSQHPILWLYFFICVLMIVSINSEAHTQSCTLNHSEVVVNITTGNLPDDGTWTIEDDIGLPLYNSSPFLNPNTLYSDTICITNDMCFNYTFTTVIGESSYEVILNDSVLGMGGGNGMVLTESFPLCTNNLNQECELNESELVVNVMTGNLSNNDWWSLTDKYGVAYENFPGGGIYDLLNTSYTDTLCVPNNTCLNFSFLSLGGSEATYNLILDGNLIESGGGISTPPTPGGYNFCTGMLTNTDTISVYPSQPCTLNESEVIIKIFTDNFPNELAWDISNKYGLTYANTLSNPYIYANTYYEDTICLPSDSCYTFSIHDFFGDGLCSNWGNGFYELVVDGNSLSSATCFGLSDYINFCTNYSNNTDTISTLYQETCDSSTAELVINILTDNFPAEISWDLLTKNNIAYANADIGAYLNPNTLHSDTICIPKDSCFTFTINDQFGDGLCCDWGNGSYELLLDGEIINSPSSLPEVISFCSIPQNNTTDSVSIFPSLNCNFDESEVVIKILTDNFPSEISWSVLSADGIDYLEAVQGSYQLPNTLYIDTICLRQGLCHNFTMNDNAGDGLCCDWGNGSYEIILDDIIIDSGSSFGYSKSIDVCPIGTCELNESEVVINVMTGNLPADNTEWNLTDKYGTSYGSIPLGAYNLLNTSYTDTLCIPNNTCLNFSFLTFEYTETTYELILDGDIINSGGGILTPPPLEGYNFCLDTPIVTDTMSVYPPQSCTLNESEIIIKIFTDYFPDEVSWDISSKYGFEYISTVEGTYQSTNTYYEDTICLPLDSCYVFSIHDYFGDGLCSVWGNGSYDLVVDGNLLNSTNCFGSSDYIYFCTGYSNNIDTVSTLYQESCDSSTAELVVNIFTDNFPSEISWDLLSTRDSIQYAFAETGAYMNSNTFYTDTICIPQNFCFTFILDDQFGDGLCCDWGNGSYELLLDGEIIETGNSFVNSESTSFCSISPGSSVDTISVLPSPDCDLDESEVIVRVLTDAFPADISWSVTSFDGLDYLEVPQGSYNLANTLYIDTICLRQGMCNTFTVNDIYGDGICCDWGNGTFEVILRDTIVNTISSFGNTESFVVCDTTECTLPVTSFNDYVLASDSLELVLFYQAVCSSDCLISWDFNQPVYFWEGITISNGRVIDINLSGKGLSGNLYVPELPELQALDLSYNSLTGNLPSLTSLINIGNINFSYNQFSGCFPAEYISYCAFFNTENNLDLPTGGQTYYFCDFPNLGVCEYDDSSVNISDSLELVSFYNALCNSGCYLYWPPSQPVQTWEGVTVNNGRVTRLNINYSSLTGAIPDLNLPYLEQIFIIDSQFNSPLPNFSYLQNLRELHIYGSSLTGILPPLDNLFALEVLNLQANLITGQIPDLSHLSNLNLLDLSFNNLSGCFPEELLNLCNIPVCNFNNNPGLPNNGDFLSFCNTSYGICSDNVNPNDSLELVNLYDNNCNTGCFLDWNLNDPVKQWTGIVTSANNVIGVNLASMNLSGQIPDFNLPYLRALDLSHNLFVDTIPSFTNSLTLNELRLNDNFLTGKFPDLSTHDITILKLENNQLFGCYPDYSMAHCGIANANESGYYFSLYNNFGLPENGSIPSFLSFCSSGFGDCNQRYVHPLDSLELIKLYDALCNDGCHLNWNVNQPIKNWSRYQVKFNTAGRITDIILYNQGLSGIIPDLNLPELIELNLGENEITGFEGLDSFPKLEILNLSDNRIQNFPNFSNLLKVEYINLENNVIVDTIPNLFPLIELLHLNLSSNYLFGIVPNLYDSLNLNYLLIDENKFTFEDIQVNYDRNQYINSFTYSPQYYGDVQYQQIAPPLSEFNCDIGYQWQKNGVDITGETEDQYFIPNYHLAEIGRYTLHMTAPSFVPNLEIISEPIYIVARGYDLYGQPVVYNQIMMEFDDWADKESYELAHLIPNAGLVKDSCSCNRLLYLWEFPDDEAALQVLLDINTKKEGQTEKVDANGGPNNIFNLALNNGSGTAYKWNKDYSNALYPDSVVMYILDSGVDDNAINASPYLLPDAPKDSCYSISSPGYGYTDSLSIFNDEYIDSLGHGTYGFDAITHDLDSFANIKAIPLKVFDQSGQVTLFKFVCALYHAIDNGADIINISAGYKGQPSAILEGAVQLAQQKGVFITTAAGNDGASLDIIPQYPAYYAGRYYETYEEGNTTPTVVPYNNMITIAALDSQDSLATFSNFSPTSATLSTYGVNISGYGVGGEQVISSGTSMSTFFVSRELAIEIAKDKSRDLEQVWADFDANRLVDNPPTFGLTLTGKRLDITLETTCYPYLYPDEDIFSGIYPAGVSIEAIGTVKNGENVTFTAGSLIKLDTGFVAEPQSNVTVKIQGCDGN